MKSKDKLKTADAKDMVTRKTWKEFRECGLLLFVNQILHIFGWAIVFGYDSEMEEITEVYPARVRFRGFNEDAVSKNYQKLSKYMAENAQALYEESLE